MHALCVTSTNQLLSKIVNTLCLSSSSCCAHVQTKPFPSSMVMPKPWVCMQPWTEDCVSLSKFGLQLWDEKGNNLNLRRRLQPSVKLGIKTYATETTLPSDYVYFKPWKQYQIVEGLNLRRESNLGCSGRPQDQHEITPNIILLPWINLGHRAAVKDLQNVNFRLLWNPKRV